MDSRLRGNDDKFYSMLKFYSYMPTCYMHFTIFSI